MRASLKDEISLDSLSSFPCELKKIASKVQETRKSQIGEMQDHCLGENMSVESKGGREWMGSVRIANGNTQNQSVKRYNLGRRLTNTHTYARSFPYPPQREQAEMNTMVNGRPRKNGTVLIFSFLIKSCSLCISARPAKRKFDLPQPKAQQYFILDPSLNTSTTLLYR